MSDKPEFKGCTCTYVGANCQHCRDMTDKLELKPCPFCGGKAQYADGRPDDGEWVECVKCKACSVMMIPLMEGVKGLLAERWNERADLVKPSECTEGNQDCSCCPEHRDNWRNKKGDDHER